MERGKPLQEGVRVKLPAGQKLVALTFDLCEQPSEISGYQGGMVDFLRQNQVKATFFMGGKWMLSHRDRAQQHQPDVTHGSRRNLSERRGQRALGTHRRRRRDRQRGGRARRRPLAGGRPRRG